MKRMWIAASSVGLLSLVLLFQHCGDVKFRDEDNFIDGFSTTPEGDRVFQTSFSPAKAERKPLDVIWMNDNSGSMTAEAAHVRNNFTAFVNRVSQVPDAKLTLISRIGATGNDVMVPPGSPVPYLEVNHVVGSRDGLRILRDEMGQSPLDAFLRPDAQKILIMVTDDDADIPFTQFLDDFRAAFPNQGITAFGFIGLGAALSPCQARTGTQYIQFAQATGGQTYNICDADWSNTFTMLANNVVTIGNDLIPLPQEVLSGTILKIIANGRELATTDYQLTGSGIILAPAIRQGASVIQIRIVFKDK